MYVYAYIRVIVPFEIFCFSKTDDRYGSGRFEYYLYFPPGDIVYDSFLFVL